MRWGSVTSLSDGLGGTTGDIGPHQSSVHNEQRNVLKEQSAEDCSSALAIKRHEEGLSGILLVSEMRCAHVMSLYSKDVVARLIICCI